jgi:DNA polymerase III epsilon subunit-like protein
MMAAMKLPFELVVFDLETNGLEEPDVRIVEIGAVRLKRDLDIADTYSRLVDGRPMTPEATSVNTITDDMLEGQPAFERVWKEFADYCGNRNKYVLAAWGAYFDVSVLRSEHRRIGVPYPHPGRALDIKAIAWFDSFRRGDPSRGAGLDSMCRRARPPRSCAPSRVRAGDAARLPAHSSWI